MPVVDLRPRGLDFRYRPGGAYTVALTGPSGWLSTYSFTATFAGTSLTVSEVGDELRIAIPSVLTAANDTAGERVPFLVTQVGGNVVLVGSGVASLAAAPSATLDFEVVLNGPDITVGLAVGPIGPGQGLVESIVAGDNVTVDSTDPANPIVSSTGGGGGGGSVTSVSAGHGVDISGTATDPIVDVDESELTVPQANVSGLTASLALKANAANPTFTGTVTIPDGALAIADTNGLQAALDLKAPAANPTFTGTVTIPDGALAIADTSGLQAALDAKAVDADVVHDTGAETIAGVKTFSADPLIPDEAYDATAWNGVLEPPTKNAVRDQLVLRAPLDAGTLEGQIPGWDNTAGKYVAVTPGPVDAEDIGVDTTGFDNSSATELQTLAEDFDAAITAGGGGGGGQDVITHDSLIHVGSALTFAASDTTWNNFPTIATIDVPAATGDWIEASCSWGWGTEAVNVQADICTEVSGAVVNSLSSRTTAPGDASTTSGGAGGLTTRGAAGEPVGVSLLYQVQAGDISAGSVTLRLRYRNTTSSGTQKTVASTNLVLYFGVKNFG